VRIFGVNIAVFVPLLCSVTENCRVIPGASEPLFDPSELQH